MTWDDDVRRYRLTMSDGSELTITTAYGADTARSRAEYARKPLRVVAIKNEGNPSPPRHSSTDD